jgi:hypothetical protein
LAGLAEGTNVEILNSLGDVRVTKNWRWNDHWIKATDITWIIVLLKKFSIIGADNLVAIKVSAEELKEWLQPVLVILHLVNAVMFEGSCFVKLNFKI